PRTDAKGGGAGPVTRRFAVRLAPLEEPIADAGLEMMLTGLGEMGKISATDIENQAGGYVAFEVELEGTAMDLQSVLSLLVAPELVAIEKIEDAAAQAAGRTAQPPADNGDEFFVDPEEFRRRRQTFAKERAEPVVPAPAAEPPPEPAALLPQESGYIRVATEKIDLLVNLVGELVITEAMLSRSGQLAGGSMAQRGLADLARHTRNLQESVLAIRMLPISNVFSRLTRQVRELSARLGKQVELKFAGGATELDRGLVEKISDPLMHLIRNAIDHGLETPREREAAGKPAAGTLRLRASQRGGKVFIEVSDDGRGLDRARILAQAARRGTTVAPAATDAQVWPLIFEAGLSTAQQVTDLSGRGVGMDVVRRNIQALGGTVELFSTPGWGTTVTVSVPLTLAIIDAMIVGIGGDSYVLPLASVAESLGIEDGHLHALPDQGETLRVRGDYLPVLHLARIFPPRVAPTQPGGIAVIVEADGADAALLVDELLGQQQVVVKSLEANFRKVPGLSGATVMADGSVAFILDVSHIVRLPGQRAAIAL
ncbi:MAG: chemotaxis protein CheA, partial [Ramlibacter sp.]